MPNYNEKTAVTGQAWQRCCQVVIENPRHAKPVVRFEEERVLALDGGTEVLTPAGGLALEFDPDRVIVMRDAITGEPTGKTVTYADAYALLYSAYLSAAAERDAANTPATPETGV